MFSLELSLAVCSVDAMRDLSALSQLISLEIFSSLQRRALHLRRCLAAAKEHGCHRNFHVRALEYGVQYTRHAMILIDPEDLSERFGYILYRVNVRAERQRV